MKLATVEDFASDLDHAAVTYTRRLAIESLEKQVPTMFQGATVSDPDVALWVRSLIEGATTDHMTRVKRGGSLLLLGPTGRGKTWQAYGVLRALAESGAYCQWRFTTAPDLFASLRPRSGVDSEQVYESYAEVPLLIIDDLGAQKDSEWTEEYLGRLIDHRWKWELPTLITSNVPADKFGDRFGHRVVSRFATFTRARLAGPDRRMVTE